MTDQENEPAPSAAAAPPKSSASAITAALLAAIVVAGWAFIYVQNRSHFTAAVVMLSLGWLAVVGSVWLLWRTGTSTAAETDDDDWWQPVGELDTLEREKRALLKAIKEVEFDRELGKMSDSDATELMATYRRRAIDVIKAIEAAEAGAATSIREEIEREVRARRKVGAGSKKGKGKARAEAAAAAPVVAAAAPSVEPATATPAVTAAAPEADDDAADDAADAAAADAADAAAIDEAAAPSAEAAKTEEAR